MSRAAPEKAVEQAGATEPGAPVHLAIFCADAEATAALGARLGRLLAGGDCVALSGSLGAGKTTLVQGIVAGLGSRDRVTSPTFTLVNEYSRAPGASGAALTIYHVDLYRLAEGTGPAASSMALLASTLGLDDVIGAPDALLLVEWAELDPALLPHDRLQVTLSVPETGGRLAEFAAAPTVARAQALVTALR